ncbi:hypothetical protein [Tsuneonella mangrovi]|uniref:hypothetical protein n=1 Tax=Tsuneonella mangrovi TaxID=1982042 RepID=UPI000BA27048|nr:hypothetical protein [Tsuneonella mangrovi]
MRSLLASAILLALLAAPVSAKDSLGVFSNWGAFRDPATPRCYAIAMAEKSRRSRDQQPFATVATWPTRGVRGQVHWQLSRKLGKGSRVNLQIGTHRFDLTGSGANAWAKDKAMDAAIVAAMRSASSMTIYGRDSRGVLFSDSYNLDGVATAMDAATVGCARQG